MTFVYCVAELAAGGAFSSLTLMSDGFHNLSDVVSLVIANWAAQAAKRPQSDEMSFGWARTEILGGLVNGTFLLALCLYTGLEAIFRFVYPVPVGNIDIFIIVAASGVGVNAIGTLIFCLTGEGGHSHAGGGDHGHSHGGGGGHGHSHGGGGGHDHSDDDDDDDDEHDEGHGHSHGGGGGGHGHAHGGHGKKKETKKKQRDENVYAVFLHYLGDFVSSILVLITGILIKSFDGATWTEYLDPIASLLIVGLILYTTMPLVKRCGWILLQSAPKSISTDRLKADMLAIDGVLSVHDLHIWQLVDGMIMCSSHVHVEEGLDWTFVSTSIRETLHKHGIHSSAMQPEFVPASVRVTPYCAQNCVDECEEDWCCKKPADEHQADELFAQNSYGSLPGSIGAPPQLHDHHDHLIN
jgi:solute carrier family 30 (zinc transporter), member 1